MALPQRDTLHHTYADYVRWSREHGDELIDGIAYIKEPPAPSRLHQAIVREIQRQVANALEGKSPHSYSAPFDVRLPKRDEPDTDVDTVVQPDVLIVCDPSKLDERGMRGAPDWITEVLSPSTASHDQTLKLAAYERAGVREVWLIHPTDRTVTVYRLQAGSYGRATVLELRGQTPLAEVPGVTIDWDRLLANIA